LTPTVDDEDQASDDDGPPNQPQEDGQEQWLPLGLPAIRHVSAHLFGD